MWVRQIIEKLDILERDSLETTFKKSVGESIGLSFIKVYNLWHKQVKEALRSLKLTHHQFIVLASIKYLTQNNEEINQAAIAHQSDIDVMTISTVIKNLEKAVLISRQESKKYTRSKIVILTELGEKTLAQALPIVEKIDKEFFGILGSEEEMLNTLLLKLARK